MRKTLLRILTAFAIIYFSTLGYIYSNQRALLYFPEKEMLAVEEYNLDGTKETFVHAKDGTKLQIWYHMPTKPGAPMVVYYHGNSGTIAKRSLQLKELLDLGYGFVAVSWRGFGKSDGIPSEEGLYEDSRAAVEYAKSMGFETKDIIAVGESLGSGLAVKMATEYRFKGVFLITPYTSIADRAQEIYWYLPVWCLVKDNFTSLDKIDKINAPLLIVHGDQDDIIPHTHSEALMKVAKEPKELIIYSGKGHNNLDTRAIYTEMTKYFNLNNLLGTLVRKFA